MKKAFLIVATALMCGMQMKAQSDMTPIGKHNIQLSSRHLTPETLWAMGRIATASPSPDGKRIAYQVGYYSVKQNKGHQVICVMDADGKNNTQLTKSAKSETSPVWISKGTKIAFMSGGQVWTMNADGTGRKQLTNDKQGFEGFLFSPNEKQIILIKQIPYHGSIQKNPDDLPLATGRRITDFNYRHWDEYVETIPHSFVADVTENGIENLTDIMEGEPYECPGKPFGGTEQLAWSTDSRYIAYTCRKKQGVDYATSTDTDIYLYNVATHETKNLCKPVGYKAPAYNPSKSLRNQAVNAPENLKNNPGYDMNPQFSPDGRYVAWTSMARDGYESDRNRLCVYNLATGEKTYVTEKLDTNVDGFVWGADSKSFYFLGVWHGCENIYQTNLKGEVMQLTDGWNDFTSVQLLGDGKHLLATRQSIKQATELYTVKPAKKEKEAMVEQISQENKHILDQLSLGNVQQRWVETTDGKQMMYWVILPADFDETKQYPTLLYCQGGPQSAVSQFWSYRWNFQMMAANGYVVIAPNRRGLPGFGSEWNEKISTDWTGQCIQDYLTAIDDACQNLPFVDKNRLGAVGASFGGFSVYYLAGHHNKRFKCFISHDGAFNLESMYTDTEETWFSNWEYDDAYWNRDLTPAAKRTYDNSPHKFVDRWDTPILCIHGEKDYRINANQGYGAFNAARLRGIPAELLLFPDENHWVLQPQNSVLWQRTFFGWLDRWLK